MWLLQGRFAEDSRHELSKLLKCGETYALGRKIPADIVVDSKFVSRTSCHIAVAPAQSVEARIAAVTDPLAFHTDVALRPRVTIRFVANKSRKTFTVTKQPASPSTAQAADPIEVHVPLDQQHTLEHGDSFALTTTISLRLVWRPLAVCFAARIKETAIAPLRKQALQLGIHLSPAKSRWKHGYTHLCLAQVNSTESVLCALLEAAPLVSIDYFHELFRRADLPRHDPASLETSFDDLKPDSYLPNVDAGELSELISSPTKLLPDQRRTYMLKGTTCVFFALPTDQAEMAIYKNILTTAGAHIFVHNPLAEKLESKADFAQLLMPYKNSALSYWRNSGPQARSEAPDDGLVVLAGSEHSDAPWRKACAIACSNLRIAMPSGFHTLTGAVLTADVRVNLNVIPNAADEEDTSMTLAAPTASSPPPRAADASQAREETHQADAISRRPSSPAAARAPSTAAAAAADPVQVTAEPMPIDVPSAEAATEAQRRPLTRRTRKPALEVEDAGSHTTAVAAVDAAAQLDDAGGSSISADNVGSFQSQGASQLSRSARSGLTRRTGASRTASRRSDIFDAILDSADAAGNSGGEAHASGDPRESPGTKAAAAAAAASTVPRSRRYRMDLDEEDRVQTQSISDLQDASQRGSADAGKRKSPPPAVEGSRAQKRTRTEAVADPEPAPEPTRVVRDEAHAAPGLPEGAQPDTEPQFLAALSTQRAQGGGIDDFDADFDRLHIAKTKASSGPIDRHVSRSARTAQSSSASQAGAVDEDYEAFKRMAEEELRIHVRGNFVQVDFVPLVRQRQTAAAQPAATAKAGPNFKKFRRKAEAGAEVSVTRPQVALMLPESNDYGLGAAYWEKDAETAGRSQGKTRVALDPASVEGASVDLGLDDLDEMESGDEADMTTMLHRRHGRPSQTAAQARARKRPAALVDDSDDESAPPTRATPRAATKVARTTSSAVLIDDDDDSEDEDDDGNFAGFGRSSSTRRRREMPAPASGRSRRKAF